jgi:hypothetical protein
MTVIQTLIDKQDSFEIVRDQIAGILAAEVTNQMALATAAAKDSDDWKLRIFLERSNPWEEFLNTPVVDKSPIVNVWFDNSNFDKSASNITERQMCSAVYNIDCIGYGVSSEDGAGHTPGDKTAAFEAQRAVRLVRNILMASTNNYLQLRGLVWRRWPESVTVFQTPIDSRTVQNIMGARIALSVQFNEFSPQYTGQELELASIDIKRESDGLVLLETDYEYPL